MCIDQEKSIDTRTVCLGSSIQLHERPGSIVRACPIQDIAFDEWLDLAEAREEGESEGSGRGGRRCLGARASAGIAPRKFRRRD